MTSSESDGGGAADSRFDSPHAPDPEAAYFEWNDRIFERFFSITDTNPVRILSLDDGELRAIAKEMGGSPDDFKQSIRALVRHLPDPFQWWSQARSAMETRDPPFYVGLLGLFSLAASECGETIDGVPRFFHRQLGRLLGLGDVPFVNGFSHATLFYDALGEYLRVNSAGRRGRLLFASNPFGGKYVWRARVQVLLNAATRRQLASYFDHRCANRHELKKDDIRVLLVSERHNPNDNTLSPALRRTLELVLSESEELFEGFVDLIETEYIRWFLDRTLVPDASTTPTQRKATQGASSAVVEATTTARETPRRNRISYEKRLILRSEVGGRPWHLSVQVRRKNSDWENARKVQFSWGEGSITYELPDGTQGSLVVDDSVTFANDGTGWISTSQLRAGDLCAVLCTRDAAELIRDAFDAMKGTDCLIRDCAEASQLAIVTTRTPRATPDTIPDALRHLLAPDQVRITFRRGLRIGTKYFQTAPPQVYFDHPTIERAEVTLDGMALKELAACRREYALPRNLVTGLHFVDILGMQRAFTLASTLVSSKMDPDDCEGFGVCQARGIAAPLRIFGAAPYMNTRAIVVIGGLIL